MPTKGREPAASSAGFPKAATGLESLASSPVSLEELKTDPHLREAVRALCRKSFYHFVRQAWQALYPNRPFLDGRHILVVCLHLQALTFGLFDRLIINIPPRHMKSTLVCVLWVAWRFGPLGERKEFLFASLAQKLSARDSTKCRELLKSEWFRVLWPEVKFKRDQDQKINWEIEGGGKRDTTSKGSDVTGAGGDIQGVDDLHDLSDNATAIAHAIEWYMGTWSSRENFGQTNAQMVIIMQRVASGDLTDHVMETEGVWKPGEDLEPGKWIHLSLPCEYDPAHHCITPIGGDWRTTKGDLLWPEAYDHKWVERKKRQMGPKAWAAKYQQEPVPEGGKEFEAEWFTNDFQDLVVEDVDRWLLSVDCAFADGPNMDNVSIQLIALSQGWYYIVEELTRPMSWRDTKKQFKLFYDEWRALGVPILTNLIERAANGFALCDEFRRKMPGVISWPAVGSKTSRARATTGIWEARQVRLPAQTARVVSRRGGTLRVVKYLQPTWRSAYEKQFLKFPDPREHDDSVDATTQAILYLETEVEDTLPLPMVG